MLSLNEVCARLSDNDDFLILTHKRPDEDTLGGALALTRLLQSLGKNARAVCSDSITDKQKKLMDGYGFEDGGEPYSYVISVDVASASLLGAYAETPVDLMIDHHVFREQFAKEAYVESDFASCAEIILEIAEQFESAGKFRLTKQIASYLYCGISSDTGGFIYSNTKPQTHIRAAKLLAVGIPHTEIDEALHITKSHGRIKAEGYALSSMKTYADGAVASVSIDKRAQVALGLTNEDISDLVNIPRSVDGVDIAVSVKEEQPGIYKASLRSKYADVSQIAAKFGGGGHVRASGCTVSAFDADEACDKIVTECEKYIKTVKE